MIFTFSNDAKSTLCADEYLGGVEASRGFTGSATCFDDFSGRKDYCLHGIRQAG